MKWTNKYNLPEPLAQAIMLDEHRQDGDWSVSETVGPVQVAILRRKHDDEIVSDVSDKLWILLGKAVHYIIEKFSGGKEHVLEKHMVLRMESGKTVSGTLDYLNLKTMAIDDWKVTSVYKATKGDATDWATQLNRYGLMALRTGLINAMPKVLRNQLIIRDWLKRDSKIKAENGYPPVQYKAIEHDVQQADAVEYELNEKVNALERAMLIQGDKALSQEYPCTPEDMWAKPDMWAVCKTEGRAVPKGLHYNQAEASIMLGAKGKGYHMEYRPGERTRCKDYCDGSPFCQQWADAPKKPETLEAV